MEQPKLPSNIDSEVLALTKTLGNIADAYKALAQTVQNQAEELKSLKEDQAPKTED